MIVISAEHIEAASIAVRKAIEEVQGPFPPAFVVEFLLKEWRRYLALVHQQDGDQCEAWRQAIATMDKLLWSVAPKATAEDRTSVADALPDLVHLLKAGMEAINTDTVKREAFLSALGDMHLGMLHPSKSRPGAVEDLSDTISMNVRDPRYRELLDLMSSDNVEQIDIK